MWTKGRSEQGAAESHWKAAAAVSACGGTHQTSHGRQEHSRPASQLPVSRKQEVLHAESCDLIFKYFIT